MPMVELAVNHHVAAAQQHRIAGEAAAGGDADQRHQAAQPREAVERVELQAADRDRVGVAAAPAAAFREQHQRDAPLLGQLEDAVLLLVALLALRAGEHRVIVGHDGDATALRREMRAVDARHAHDQRIRLRRVDQGLQVGRAAAGGDHQRAILGEGTGVAQIGDVLACGPLVGAAAARHGIGPVLIARLGLARQHLREIRADLVEVDGACLLARRAGGIARLDEEQRMALEYGVAAADGQLAHHAADCGLDDVLHLHRFHHQHLLAGAHDLARRHVEADDRALHRCRQRHGPVGTGNVARLAGRCLDRGRRRLGRGAAALAMVEHGQWIAGIDARAGEARRRLRLLREIQTGVCVGAGCQQGREIFLDVARVGAAVSYVVVLQQALQEGDVGRHADDAELRQGAIGACHRIADLPGRAVHDHLGEQRIEAWIAAIAAIAEAIDANAGPARRLEGGESAAGRAHAAVRLHALHVDTHLQRHAARHRYLLLPQAQSVERGTAGDLELQVNQVETGHLLGHGVLDLQARIGLDEGDGCIVALALGIDQELEGAEAAKFDLRRHAQRR